MSSSDYKHPAQPWTEKEVITHKTLEKVRELERSLSELKSAFDAHGVVHLERRVRDLESTCFDLRVELGKLRDVVQMEGPITYTEGPGTMTGRIQTSASNESNASQSMEEANPFAAERALLDALDMIWKLASMWNSGRQDEARSSMLDMCKVLWRPESRGVFEGLTVEQFVISPYGRDAIAALAHDGDVRSALSARVYFKRLADPQKVDELAYLPQVNTLWVTTLWVARRNRSLDKPLYWSMWNQSVWYIGIKQVLEVCKDEYSTWSK